MPNLVSCKSIMRLKNSQMITLTFFLGLKTWNFICIFQVKASQMIENRWQNRLPYEKSFKMSYQRSWLNNFEIIWPKTSLWPFEIWIILRLQNTFLPKTLYYSLLVTAFTNSQDIFGTLDCRSQTWVKTFQCFRHKIFDAASIVSARFLRETEQ